LRELKVGYADLLGSHLTQLALQKQKHFVGPYRWQLLYCGISRLGYDSSNFTLHSSSESNLVNVLIVALWLILRGILEKPF